MFEYCLMLLVDDGKFRLSAQLLTSPNKLMGDATRERIINLMSPTHRTHQNEQGVTHISCPNLGPKACFDQLRTGLTGLLDSCVQGDVDIPDDGTSRMIWRCTSPTSSTASCSIRL